MCTLFGTPVVRAVEKPVETTVYIPGGTQVCIQIDTSVNKESNDEVTPNKRKRFMDSLDLTTPSPLVKSTHEADVSCSSPMGREENGWSGLFANKQIKGF